MAYQGISTGSGPNQGDGDTLIDGAKKINSNFQEIYNTLGDGSFLGNASLTSLSVNSGSVTISTGIVTAASFVGNGSQLTGVVASYTTKAGVATYATSSGIATYASTAGIATYATTAGIATNATYAINAGIATYATSSGIATYAINAGIATYATSSGIATYATSSGVSTNVIGGIASVTQLNVSGISTFSSSIIARTITGVSTAGINTIYTSSINDCPLSGSRNVIINGNFDVWQRGTTSSTWVSPVSEYYQADRWVANSSGTGGNGSLSQQSFTVGQTDVPNEPTYFLRWTITSAASGQTAGSCWIEQRVEDVRTFAGREVTVSFWAKGSGTFPGFYLTQTFGTGGSAQVTYTLATNIALNATWTKYTYTTTLSSISGKTIGTGSYIGFTIQVPLNITYTLDLAQVQLERGPISTIFERRSYGQELVLCQRYYQQGKAWGYVLNDSATNLTQGGGSCVNFATQMRASPTVSRFSGSSFTALNVDQNGFGFKTTGGQLADQTTNATYAATAEL